MKIEDINDKTTVEDFLTLKKSDLVLFLRSSSAKISGNKDELARRAFETNQINNGVTASLSTVLVSQHSYTNDNVDIPPYNELNSGWTSDLSLLPLVSHQDVESFLIHSSHRTGDNEKMLCYRQFIRGYNFFKENYVHDLMINSIDDDCESCYIRSKCYPSMKQQGPYQQWILISKKTPVVVFKANCSCPAGLGEGCTHIAGLLFKLEACAQEKENTACTSKPCNWNKGGKRKKDPQEVLNISFKKLKYGGNEPCANEKKNKFIVKNSITDQGQDFLSLLTAKLGNLNYSPAIFDLVAPSCEVYDINSDINVVNFEEVETSEYLHFESDNYIDIMSIVQKEPPINETILLDKFVNIPQTVIDEIEKRTLGQSENQLWFDTRKFRITSSNFHSIVSRKKADVDKLVQSFSKPGKVINAAPLIWGRKHEPIARKKYIAHRRLKYGEKIFVKECGIFLCDKFGFLGASPDGLVKKCTKLGEEKCVLEIKCPWKWRMKTIREACASKDFFLETDEQNNMQLKKSHKYFSQIQGQMGICKYENCDLVIYLLNDFLTVEVKFDKLYWENMEQKLIEFYKENMVPHIVSCSQSLQSVDD
ncbi:uncharacterized protein LOC143051582 [Mytilus galloprovincialis]|uniref:uncharacterized protein LOC143051582 n=1 Tax=Mytilus galloprovincialis TaxID=29158 RepID=UPI003F7C94A3